MTARRGRGRGRGRRQRGAVFVEVLVVVPVLVTLWIVLLFLERGNTVDQRTMQHGRYCAWRFAADECQGAPAGCELEGPWPESPGTLDAASGGALTRLSALFPFLAQDFEDPHGHWFSVTARDQLTQPFGWGEIAVESHQTWMCQTRRGRWTPQLVFSMTCQLYGLPYCSL